MQLRRQCADTHNTAVCRQTVNHLEVVLHGRRQLVALNQLVSLQRVKPVCSAQMHHLLT